jgi:hypothetical protein
MDMRKYREAAMVYTVFTYPMKVVAMVVTELLCQKTQVQAQAREPSLQMYQFSM